MKAEAIFLPVSVLALWTGAVLLLTGALRVIAVVRGHMPIRALVPGETPEVPARVALANRNFMNLLEMPVLFYVNALCWYATAHVGAAVLTLAWVYVALRVVHSIVHLTYNRVTHRLVPFALSNFVLLALWVVFMRRVLEQHARAGFAGQRLAHRPAPRAVRPWDRRCLEWRPTSTTKQLRGRLSLEK